MWPGGQNCHQTRNQQGTAYIELEHGSSWIVFAKPGEAIEGAIQPQNRPQALNHYFAAVKSRKDETARNLAAGSGIDALIVPGQRGGRYTAWSRSARRNEWSSSQQ
jgi:hypothetical protein